MAKHDQPAGRRPNRYKPVVIGFVWGLVIFVVFVGTVLLTGKK